MTVSAAEGLSARPLPGERDQHVHDEGPDARAPEEGDEELEVQPRPGSRGGRGHTVTVLFCLVVVQLAWLAALTYGALSLLR